MPTVALHSHYWQTQAATPPGPSAGSSRGGGYTAWQATIIGCMVLMLLIQG
jgi:hypothetical protein